MAWRVSLCSLSRLLATVRQLLVQRIDVLFTAGSCLELNWTEHGSAAMCVFKDSGACLFGCVRLSHSGSCCEPPTASPLGHRCTVVVLAESHRCGLMPRVASKQSANPLWLLECGLVNVSWWSSKQGQRDFTALLLYAFRVPCLTTFLDSWSLESENTYTPARRAALFCEHFVAPTSSAGCKSWMLFNEILLPTNLDRHALHLIRNLIAPFLLAACFAAVHLVHPDADPFRSQEIAQPRMLSGTATAVAAAGAPSAALEKLPHRSLW